MSEKLRLSREQSQRSAEPIHDEHISFEETGPLPEITPRPGYVQRWVRVGIKNDADSRNIARSMQLGWSPRSPDTVPVALQALTVQRAGMGGVIGVHDMVLMERREEIEQKSRAHELRKAKDQERAVQNNFYSEHKNLGGNANGIIPNSRFDAQVERGRPMIKDD